MTSPVACESWPPGIEISDQPVRRVHTRGRRRNTSLIYSSYPLGVRVSESSHETLFLQVAQLDTTLRCVRAQPCWLRVVEDGHLRRRAPDFAVLFDDHAELHEVKEDRECWRPEVRSELLAVAHEVERHPNWRYSVTLASQLRAEPLFSNTALLWRHLRPAHEISCEARVKVAEMLGDRPRVAAEAAERLEHAKIASTPVQAWSVLLSLVAGGLADFDVGEKLTLETILWNKDSGPSRQRTLPFTPASAAVQLKLVSQVPAPFCAIRLRKAVR